MIHVQCTVTNHRSGQGCTIHDAAMKGDVEALEELLDSGTCPDSQDEEGWSALHHAVQAGNNLKRELQGINSSLDYN